MSDDVTTQPVGCGSSWIDGTGMKACVPSGLRRLVTLPVRNAVLAGQLEIGALPCGLSIYRRSDRLARVELVLV
jgi:hypothetical protein